MAAKNLGPLIEKTRSKSHKGNPGFSIHFKETVHAFVFVRKPKKRHLLGPPTTIDVA